MNNNKEIFKLLKYNKCDILSKYNVYELNNIFYLLNNYYLILRKNIKINKNITFGCEIELENIKQHNALKKLIELNLYNSYNSWNSHIEPSVNFGCEVITPIMSDKQKYWKELNLVCNEFSKRCYISELCGGHIHIGNHIFDNNIKYYLNLLKLWMCYEKVIYRFSSNEYLKIRESIYYAKPLAYSILQQIEYINNFKYVDQIKELFGEKKQAINFLNIKSNILERKNTIEFRCPSSTLSSTIWQNNVNFFSKLLIYCCSNKFDDNKINNKINKIKEEDVDIKNYNKLYIDDALELCDMIFDNNLDKVYFLRQYTKDFEEYEIGKPIVKIFVKK